MKRRDFLGLAAGAGLAACPICARLAWAADAPSAPQPWSYKGPGGPDHWVALAPENRACGVGAEQSPIDLKDPIRADLPPLKINYRSQTLRILNDGHGIQINAEPGQMLAVGAEHYELEQYHFHHPSEHLVAGRRFAMELHLVHRHSSSRLVTLAVLLAEGAENRALAPIWANLPESPGPERLIGALKLNPASLLPRRRQYFDYAGSLTVPPCSEVVSWIVFSEPVELSKAQIDKFAAIYPMNARPLMAPGRRFVLLSR
jgi:carbonic anhydrase